MTAVVFHLRWQRETTTLYAESMSPAAPAKSTSAPRAGRKGLADVLRQLKSKIRTPRATPVAGAKATRKEIRARLVKIFHDLTAKRIRYHRAYQPISVGKTRSKQTTRECEDRWAMVAQAIKNVQARSLLDLGCAEGYFVRKAGEMGLFAIGVDRDYNRLGLIESARMIDKSEHSGFVLSSIDPDLLKTVPQFDVVLCFSVMHHIIRQNSYEHGLEMLRLMRRVTKKVFLFDMGQTNEISTTWASKLPNMGDDPAQWIAAFLRDGGFTDCELVGETDAYRDAIKRYVFRCTV